jgi:hypothetical protein
VTGQFQDELWQPSLDDVLGDSPTKGGHASQKTASGPSNTPGTSTSNSAESSPRKWREWDAGKADKTLREIQAASELPAAGPAKSFPLLVDTYREVTIRNGARVKVAKAGTASGKGSVPARRPPPSRQLVVNAKSLAKMGNDKKQPVEQKSQPVKRFKYLGAAIVTKTPRSKLKSPSTSPLQPVSTNLSATAPPIRIPDQTVSVSLETVPHLHHFEGFNDPFSNISLDLRAKKDPYDYIFQELAVKNSTNDEEDLISFD